MVVVHQGRNIVKPDSGALHTKLNLLKQKERVAVNGDDLLGLMILWDLQKHSLREFPTIPGTRDAEK
ncbi:unnamed protein product, partial [Vitis vinifera]